MRKVLTGVLFTALFLLLLSALVVAEPETEATELPAEPTRAVTAFALCPAPSTEPAGSLPFVRRQPERALVVPAVDGGANLSPTPFSCDANGRVVCQARYVSSVYQLFRPEIAGG